MLTLEAVSPTQYRAPTLSLLPNLPVVFGGQLLAQLVMASSGALDGRSLASLHAVFCRPGKPGIDLRYDTEILSNGRNAASVRVRCHQDGPTCVEALALSLTAQDLPIAHQPPPPAPPRGPAASAPISEALQPIELRRASDVDPDAPETVAPPALYVWARPRTPVTSAAEAQAVLALASEPILAGAGLLPHDGWAITQAYQRFAPAVLSHNLSFHADPGADGSWWLFAICAPDLSNGRIFGRAEVFREDGTHVASVQQENLLRPIAPD